jgi:Asp-tRNA(Asn)/Glu-tRNA(Gln) amidotransferase A subunit family amidase
VSSGGGPLYKLFAAEAAKLIAVGAITSEALIRACLARIEQREPMQHAWPSLDPGFALRQAREHDQGRVLGPR